MAGGRGLKIDVGRQDSALSTPYTPYQLSSALALQIAK